MQLYSGESLPKGGDQTTLWLHPFTLSSVDPAEFNSIVLDIACREVNAQRKFNVATMPLLMDRVGVLHVLSE